MAALVKTHNLLLLRLYALVIFWEILPIVEAAETTRCYDKLGCYDSGIFHALPQDPTHIRTHFIGSCRGHVDDVIIEAVNGETEWRKQIDNSSLDGSQETVFITHGFSDSSSSSWVGRMRDAFLAKKDVNVFSVDWSHGALLPYEQAVANTFLVARQLSVFVEYLLRVHGLSPLRVHLIGHSLGAQISGNAGMDLQVGRVGRITGLDPAEPLFGYLNDSMRLDASDALFVDVIHTDGEQFSGFRGYGSLRPQGHVDFYPNGGVKQPGCNAPDSPFGILTDKPFQTAVACSHSRAVDLFISSLETSSQCTFRAQSCSSWEEFDKGTCTKCPTLGCPAMGLYYSLPTHNGSFFLSTGSDQPFCGQTYIVKLVTAPNQRHSYGQVLIRLNGTHGMTNQTDFTRSNHHFHKNESETHVITFTSEIGDITSAEFEFRKGNGLSSLGTDRQLRIASVSISLFDGTKRTTENLHKWNQRDSLLSTNYGKSLQINENHVLYRSHMMPPGGFTDINACNERFKQWLESLSQSV